MEETGASLFGLLGVKAMEESPTVLTQPITPCLSLMSQAAKHAPQENTQRVCAHSPQAHAPHIAFHPILPGFLASTKLGRPQVWERLVTGASKYQTGWASEWLSPAESQLVFPALHPPPQYALALTVINLEVPVASSGIKQYNYGENKNENAF